MAKASFSDQSQIMGIVNVTPDSFSDGGRYMAADQAVRHGLRLAQEGADILDIGGESTRPGAAPVSAQEEMDRVLPVIEGLKGCGARLSIDTRQAVTMSAAIAAGADMINDITALEGDPESLNVAASFEGPICLMHMQGQPQTMQDKPVYEDVVAEVYEYLAARLKVCEDAGISRDRLIADPGIGFGKTLEHNLLLLKNLDRFYDLGVPVLLGVSRKSFISGICEGVSVDKRLPGSLAAALYGLQKGAHIFRVHDVAETRQALFVWETLRNS